MSIDFNKTLAAATLELANIDKKLKVSTKGTKKYTMVADRIRIFRKHFGVDAQIDTTQTFDENYVRSETTISVGGDRVANGIAEEDRRFGPVNKTSAAENAETSSIGRALSNLGLQGGEYPSGDELLIAIKQQEKEFPVDNNVYSQAGKPDDASGSRNKSTAASSQHHQDLPPGWDEMDLVTQIQTFSSVIEKATHPGQVDKLKTPYEPWFKKQDREVQKELIEKLASVRKGILNAKN